MSEISWEQAKRLSEKAKRTWGMPENVTEDITALPDPVPQGPSSPESKRVWETLKGALDKAEKSAPKA